MHIPSTSTSSMEHVPITKLFRMDLRRHFRYDANSFNKSIGPYRVDMYFPEPKLAIDFVEGSDCELVGDPRIEVHKCKHLVFYPDGSDEYLTYAIETIEGFINARKAGITFSKHCPRSFRTYNFVNAAADLLRKHDIEIDTGARRKLVDQTRCDRSYMADLYIPEFKLVIDCDYKNRLSLRQRRRLREYVERSKRFTLMVYNPDASNFDTQANLSLIESFIEKVQK